MTIKFEVTDSEKQLRDMIMNAIVEKLNKIFKSSKQDILQEIQEIVVSGLQQTQEYEDLTLGKLKVEFGFMMGEEKNIIDPIINRIADSIEIEMIPFKWETARIRGGMQIKMLRADFSDILSLPQAITKPEGYGFESIPWLEWYLGYGGQVVIRDFGIQYGVFPENSRSGYGIMVQDQGPYIVPGDNSVKDNWFTRFFSSTIFEQAVFSAVESAITRKI